MAGHSKWANIKRQKAVVDAKRGVIYAKVAREIIVATKQGGPDPQANFRLRQAIERAKQEGVPNDNIERAIEKGSGQGAADNMEDLVYEGYGPGGVAILVKCTTDNRNRTAGDVRSYFSKYGGNLGENGCVSWMFTERGEVTIDKSTHFDEEELLTVAVEAGADDMETEEEEPMIICSAENLLAVKDAIEKSKHTVTSSKINMHPSNTVDITDEEMAKQLLKLMDALENHDDVQHVYANFEMDESFIEGFMG